MPLQCMTKARAGAARPRPNPLHVCLCERSVLKASNGTTVTLSSFKGKKPVVLFFYPKAATPGCTKEVTWAGALTRWVAGGRQRRGPHGGTLAHRRISSVCVCKWGQAGEQRRDDSWVVPMHLMWHQCRAQLPSTSLPHCITQCRETSRHGVAADRGQAPVHLSRTPQPTQRVSGACACVKEPGCAWWGSHSLDDPAGRITVMT